MDVSWPTGFINGLWPIYTYTQLNSTQLNTQQQSWTESRRRHKCELAIDVKKFCRVFIDVCDVFNVSFHFLNHF